MNGHDGAYCDDAPRSSVGQASDDEEAARLRQGERAAVGSGCWYWCGAARRRRCRRVPVQQAREGDRPLRGNGGRRKHDVVQRRLRPRTCSTRLPPRPAGTVFRQSPTAFVKAEKGTTVTLTVSQGPGQVYVPPVVDLSQNQAKQAITAAGLKIARVLTENSARCRAARRPEPRQAPAPQSVSVRRDAVHLLGEGSDRGAES